MPRGVYERKNKKNKVIDGNTRVAARREIRESVITYDNRVVMSLRVPVGGVEIKLTNGNDRVIGTVQLTSDGLMMSRPNQKKKPDRLISYVSLSKLMELGLL